MAGVFYGNSVVTNPLWLFRRLRPGAAGSETRAVSNAGTCMSDVLVANVIFPKCFFWDLLRVRHPATILIDVFILVYPNSYVILRFVLKGHFIGVFSRHSCSLRQIPRRKRSASSP